MSDNRYNRWQGLAVAQLSVAVALISGLSVAGLGAGLSLVQKDTFVLSGWWKCAFALSQAFFVIATFLSCAAVITRLLDFRLTARSVRKQQRPEYNRPLTIFGCGSEGYGRATWRLFWPSCVSLTLGAVLLIASIAIAYADRLH
jgi:hypothetical protein